MLESIRLIFVLLDTGFRQHLMVLMGMTIIGAVLEVIGIGLVLPVMALLLGQIPPDDTLATVGWIFNFIPEVTSHNVTMVGLALLLGVFVVKNLFLTLLTVWQMRFVGIVQGLLSQRLFNLYMRQPHAFHLRRNSAELLRNAVIEVDELSGKAVIPLLTLVVEGVMSLAIAAVLLAIDPVAAVVAAVVVSTSGWALYTLSQRPMKYWAEQRQHHEGQRLLQFQQGLRMAKEIKLLGREDALFDWYRFSVCLLLPPFVLFHLLAVSWYLPNPLLACVQLQVCCIVN